MYKPGDTPKSIFEKLNASFDPDHFLEPYLSGDVRESFRESTEILKIVQNLSDTEAYELLADIIVKMTFIERNLCENGAQTAEELMTTLQEKCEDGKAPNPFSCPAEIAEFCDQMSPIFLKDKFTRKYKNSSAAFRILVVEMRQFLLKNGTADRKDFRKVLNSMQSKWKTNNDFLKYEHRIDCGVPNSMSSKIPDCFEYDFATATLRLKPAGTAHLSLILPVLFLNADTYFQHKQDESRVVERLMQMIRTGYMQHRGRVSELSMNPSSISVEPIVMRKEFPMPTNDRVSANPSWKHFLSRRMLITKSMCAPNWPQKYKMYVRTYRAFEGDLLLGTLPRPDHSIQLKFAAIDRDRLLFSSLIARIIRHAEKQKLVRRIVDMEKETEKEEEAAAAAKNCSDDDSDDSDEDEWRRASHFRT
ncbi:unnamed protein product [Caenorhabditis sp. 36 PRJEB53466]|nr:unnamed protein product [Caenorhabditis sp. 36 PRJEB53466]